MRACVCVAHRDRRRLAASAAAAAAAAAAALPAIASLVVLDPHAAAALPDRQRHFGVEAMLLSARRRVGRVGGA